MPDTHDLWILNTQTRRELANFRIIFLNEQIKQFKMEWSSVWSFPPGIYHLGCHLSQDPCNPVWWAALPAPLWPRCNLAIVTFIVIIPEYQSWIWAAQFRQQWGIRTICIATAGCSKRRVLWTQSNVFLLFSPRRLPSGQHSANMGPSHDYNNNTVTKRVLLLLLIFVKIYVDLYQICK